MVMKGSVQPGHIPVNNFELFVLGLPKILFVTVSGLEEETESVDLPDRTVASGGNVKATEFTAQSFEHHTVERAAMDLWRLEAVDAVNLTYKKIGTLIKRNIHGQVVSTSTLIGLWVKAKKGPDLDLGNEGDPALIEWTLSTDKVQPI